MKRILAFAVVTAAATTVVVAAFGERRWKVADGDWNVAANWTTGHVPGPNDFVQIMNEGTARITAPGAVAGTINIYQGSGLFISGSGDFTTGRINLYGGDLRVEGGAEVIFTSFNTPLRAGGEASIILDGAGSRIDLGNAAIELEGDRFFFLDFRVSNGAEFISRRITTAADTRAVIRVGTGGTAGILSAEVRPESGFTRLQFDHTDDITFARKISGPVLVTKDGDGTLTLAGPNSFTEGTQVLGGTLRLGGANAIGSGELKVFAPGRLDMNGFDWHVVDFGGTGNIELESATLKVTLEAISREYRGVLTGNTLIKAGSAVLQLTGANVHSSTIVQEGSLLVDGTQPASGVVVAGSRALLGGRGRLGALTVTSGTIAPGGDMVSLNQLEDTDATLSTGSVSLTSSATLAMSFSDAMAGGNHDRLDVSGSVTLNNPALELTRGGSIPGGLFLTLIANDGGDPVSGTFAGLPEGAYINASGEFFRISYAGGDGNDVTLEAIAPLDVGPPELPALTVGEPVDITLLTTGGVAPYTYAVTTGELPAGLTLDGDAGEISGIPTTAGPYAFTITSEDSLGALQSTDYAGEVLPAPVPSLPQIGLWALAIALAGAGYARLRASSSS